ncbi:MAG: hypothetical protein WD341_00260 [Tistlia sp.]|uniref:hypothetical protein n=1 Tax=Tistlia sp. TaxID=3057121 RepID=UPI0034A3F7FD
MQYLPLLLGLPLLPLVVVCMLRWRWGFLGLLIYMPFAGVVTLALHPADFPKLLKDLLFAIPCLVMFFASGRDGLARAALPSWLGLAIALFAFVAFAQAGNPSLYDWRVAVIGLKVALLYIPLIYVAAAYCETRADVELLMRRLLLVGLVPCLFGILCFFLAIAVGYQPLMTALYGEAARGVTQGFTRFDFGTHLGRFNSTFTFAAQYGQFTLAMLVPGYAVAFGDSQARWRLLGRISLAVFVVAGLLSGSRSLFVFAPLLLLLALLVDARITKLLAGVLLGPLFMLAVLELLGFDVLQLFTGVGDLAASYSQDVAVGDLLGTLAQHPLGTGTGMGTVAARHVLPDTVRLVTVENYYAKIVLEMGVFGLLALLALFGGILLTGFGARRQTGGTALQPVASILFAYLLTIMVTSGKGWALDLDPVNVYFWVFAGLLLKLPRLASPATAAAAAPQQHPFLASLRRPPVLLRPARPGETWPPPR